VAQARISPRFWRSRFGSFRPIKNLRRTIGAIEALCSALVARLDGVGPRLQIHLQDS
jgi:hypothetical protein